ncbi:biotin transport system substrate-specific component [Loktanella sp. DSM 29012]|uniref:biotin transporter BioY n=1 Tax=Loktanella sp. DSM 29012 TaxID=1881056 RepID=UPI0008C0C848|nr:biotin transporter BioY [Loktanella sp. DSM 29012]SEQ19550.1 biotin transport system substrate-specific component [Loktanella sp. DSM 29012]
MALTLTDKVLGESFGATEGTALRVKQVALVIAGIAFLAIAAKIKVPMWPVPITMGTFAVLTLGAAYGPRLGLVTIMGYMILGALGLDVFAGTGADASGLTYMLGGTGGYLVGYVLATVMLGYAARAGYDRSVKGMVAALIAGNVAIYVPGLLWLGVLYGWDQPILAWGLTPFLVGDLVKLVLAALLVPSLWKLVANARG